MLGVAALAGAVFKFVMSGLRLVPETFTLAGYLWKRTIGYVGVSLSPALLAKLRGILVRGRKLEISRVEGGAGRGPRHRSRSAG